MNHLRLPDGSYLPSLFLVLRSAPLRASRSTKPLIYFPSSFETAAARPPQDKDRKLSPCRQPALGRGDRELTQGIIGDRLDRLADERLDQQRLCLLLGKAARPQVKQQTFVKRTSGRTMAAGDVVGEDFEFRLVVGFGLVGQEQRPRHHLGVGLLRVRAYDDAALKHRMSAVVDHGAEDFTARAV